MPFAGESFVDGTATVVVGRSRDGDPVPAVLPAVRVSLPDELLLIAVVDLPADLAAWPLVGVYVYISVTSADCLNKLLERPGFDAYV